MKRIIATLAVASLGIPVAAADDWEHSVTPYLWAAGQSGDSGARDTKAGDLIGSYDLSAGDVFDRLDEAFLIAYRAQKDDTWGLMFDLVYMKVEDDDAIRSLDINIENPQFMLSAA